tara:strand:+ start:227 stop:1303 length:1077 start_codon:yes stop_codon:yes gene_type:complete
MIYQFFAKYIKQLPGVILILFLNSPLMADDDLFFSEMNIEVKIPYDYNSNIRNLAISKAEKLAFEEISKKLLAPREYNQIIELNDINYEYLVESIEFADEKISSETYSGNFNVYFSPFKVREFYDSRSLIYSELSSKDINANIAFSNHFDFFTLFNKWNIEWKKINNIGSKINLNIRTFSSSEMHQLDLATFLEGSNLNEVDNVKDAVLIWCNPSNLENDKIKFEIIIKLIANNKENVLRKTYIEENSFYRDDIFDQIIIDINSELLSVWIDLTKQSNEIFLYNFIYDINSIDDWVKLRTEFETLELLDSFHVTAFNLSKIEGVINFSGNNNKLELIMSQNNIRVVNMGSYYKISLYD